MSEGDYQIAEARVQEVLDRQNREERDTRTTIVACSACGGDGGFEVFTGYDPRDGSPTGYWAECRNCNGEGNEEIELEPLTIDDLALMAGEQP